MNNQQALRNEVQNMMRDISRLQQSAEQILQQLSADEPDNDLDEFLHSCSILHPTKGVIPLEVYDFQKQMLLAFESSDFVVVLKARQMGLTTLTALYALYLAASRPNYSVWLVTNQFDTARAMMDRILVSAKNGRMQLPFAIEATAKGIKFSNGSAIIPSACSGVKFDTVPDCIIINEAANISYRSLSDMWIKMVPLMNDGLKVIMWSTARYDEGHFRHCWTNAELMGAARFMCKWSDHPDRDEAWAVHMKSQIGEEAFRREYECEFLPPPQ